MLVFGLFVFNNTRLSDRFLAEIEKVNINLHLILSCWVLGDNGEWAKQFLGNEWFPDHARHLEWKIQSLVVSRRSEEKSQP